MKLIRTLPLVLVFTLLLAIQPVGAAQSPHNSSTGSDTQQVEPSPLQSRQSIIDAIRQNMGLFGTVYRIVNERYVDPINPDAFIKAGLNGMLGTLDPYTEYLEPEGSDDLKIMSRGKYGGVGLQIGTRGSDRILTVITPMEGTPAWRLGIRAGDQIIEINGESTQGFTTSDAAERLRGEAGTPVKIKVHRFGVEEPIEYTIVRENIQVNDVSYAGMIEPGIGYVRLTRFSRQAGLEVRQAIQDLLDQKMQGMILDLRSNPGGLLPEAISVAECFLDPGEEIVSTRGRTKDTFNEYKAQEPPTLPDNIPLVVLVNEGSASASEIVSGAIQDQDRGLIVGQPSFGKGLVQSVINFNDGTALRVTTAKYYTPSGRLIQKIDYFSNNKSIFVPDDSTAEDTVFHTANGRKVLAHGGITPDIEVQMPEVGDLTLALWRQDKYFDFVSQYMNEHPDVHDWKVTDAMYGKFLAYLDSSKFTYESETQHNLDKIREEAEKKSYGPEFMTELTGLDSLATVATKKLYQTERPDIEFRIKLELASALSGSAGRVKASLDYDPQIKKAVDVLREKDEYASTLSGVKTAKAE